MENKRDPLEFDSEEEDPSLVHGATHCDDIMKGAAKLAPFNPSSNSVIDSLWRLAEVNSYDTVYDLGCGDGRLLIHTAVMTKAKCVGIEFNKRFVQRAREKVASDQDAKDLVDIRYGDICKTDLDYATVIFCFLNVKGNEDFEERMKDAYGRGARIVSNMFKLDFLGEEPRKTVLVDGITNLYYYRDKNTELEHLVPFIKTLDGYLDPLKNPFLIFIFNSAIFILILVLIGLLLAGVRNIHFYAMGALAVCLLLSVNYFISVLRDALAEAKVQEEKSLNLGKDPNILDEIRARAYPKRNKNKKLD